MNVKYALLLTSAMVTALVLFLAVPITFEVGQLGREMCIARKKQAEVINYVLESVKLGPKLIVDCDDGKKKE